MLLAGSWKMPSTVILRKQLISGLLGAPWPRHLRGGGDVRIRGMIAPTLTVTMSTTYRSIVAKDCWTGFDESTCDGGEEPGNYLRS